MLSHLFLGHSYAGQKFHKVQGLSGRKGADRERERHWPKGDDQGEEVHSKPTRLANAEAEE